MILWSIMPCYSTTMASHITYTPQIWGPLLSKPLRIRYIYYITSLHARLIQLPVTGSHPKPTRWFSLFSACRKNGIIPHPQLPGSVTKIKLTEQILLFEIFFLHKYTYSKSIIKSWKLPPDTIISTKPEIKRISISVSNRLVDFEAPLNSFQMKSPHKAATIVAPCPSA